VNTITGHGIIEMSKLFEKYGVDTLCVASFCEAMEIREAGIKSNILVLAPIPNDEEIIKESIENNIFLNISSKELAETISKVGGDLNKTAQVHVKVDTGMSRVGVLYSEAIDFIKYVKTLDNINIYGVFTHLAASDDPGENDFTTDQINKMWKIKNEIDDDKIIFHCANSAAILKYPNAYMDAVRAGIIVYGYLAYNVNEKIKPILKLKSHIIHIKTLPKGVSVGYNRTFVTERETRVATVSVGYGDGYSRGFSNKAYVYINGQKAKIIGRVCMDIMMVDVTDIKAELFDDVMLYDWTHKETDIEYLASEIGTISYELLTQISARVKREYISK